ncbi:hypothetical protein KY289_035778 [Solanum tuberosum]|nr:hypothetical protein KY289_035778 [Solanum tuberosum]
MRGNEGHYILVRQRRWRGEAVLGGSQGSPVVFRLRVTNLLEVGERGKENSEVCNGDGDGYRYRWQEEQWR